MDFVLHANHIGFFKKNLRPIKYCQATTFQIQFQFILHLVVDVLAKLNRFNQNFQNNLVDISTIEFTLDASISILA